MNRVILALLAASAASLMACANGDGSSLSGGAHTCSSMHRSCWRRPRFFHAWGIAQFPSSATAAATAWCDGLRSHGSKWMPSKYMPTAGANPAASGHADNTSDLTGSATIKSGPAATSRHAMTPSP